MPKPRPPKTPPNTCTAVTAAWERAAGDPALVRAAFLSCAWTERARHGCARGFAPGGSERCK